jgi:diadenosine tetraphosphate (Ap4A) HIT family hydrolase
MTVLETCQMCRVVAGDVSVGFRSVVANARVGDEVVAAGDDLKLILDAAPVSIGHSLLVPNEHCRSLANIWCSRSDELYAIEDSVMKLLRRTVSPGVIACEHGLAADAPARAGCVEHAHLHFIPVDRPIVSAFIAAGVPMAPVVDVCDRLRASKWTQYLYLRDCDGQRYVAFRDKFPSQLVRRLVAQESKQLFWSWRDYIDFADLIGTSARLRDGMKPYQYFRALHQTQGLVHG